MTNTGPTRREFVAAMAAGTALPASIAGAATPANSAKPNLPSGADDRTYMLGILAKMATPVLGRMARGRLQREWTPELSPTWDGRNAKVAYLECFGRLIDGLAPWLSLPDD